MAPLIEWAAAVLTKPRIPAGGAPQAEHTRGTELITLEYPLGSRRTRRQHGVMAPRLYAATGTSFARLDETPDGWTVEPSLPESTAQCLALDPNDPDVVYVGLGAGGVRKTMDGARTWIDVGLVEQQVFSVAVSAADGAVYAGTEPSALFRSDDEGGTWRELAGLLDLRPVRHGASRHAPGRRTCAGSRPAHTRRTRILAGIELGGLMRSTNAARRGKTTGPVRSATCTRSRGTRARLVAPTRPAEAERPGARTPATRGAGGRGP